MITIKTVLKSGGVYKPEHVDRIYKMLEKNLDFPIKFVCYSDIEMPQFHVRKLRDDLPGWWSKMEMFRDDDGQSFYIDLDMTINRNITDIVSYNSHFIALRNMNSKIDGIGSAVMGWDADYNDLYRDFTSDKANIMRNHDRDKMGTSSLGDQGFLWEWFGGDCEIYQDNFPGRIEKFSVNPNSDIVVHFGKNKPWGRSK